MGREKAPGNRLAIGIADFLNPRYRYPFQLAETWSGWRALTDGLNLELEGFGGLELPSPADVAL
jgi:hypothetical protein